MKIKNLILVASATAAFTACNNDDAPKPDTGEKVLVSLAISQNSVATYASASTDPATDSEKNISSDDAFVCVFKENGVLEYFGSHVLVGNVSGEFQITAGTKYFCVITNTSANVKDNSNNLKTTKQILDDLSLEVNKSTRADLEKTLLKISANDADIDGITTVNKFLIGTLWGKTTTIDATTDYVANPVRVEVGRAAAKVVNKTDETGWNTASNGLSGTWSELTWTLLCYPEEMYLVGQYSGNSIPSTGSQVITPHYNTIDGTNSHFKNNVRTEKALIAYSSPSPDANSYFYTIENTNANPRWGNATQVCYKGTFTPLTVYNHANIDPNDKVTATPGSDFCAVRVYNANSGAYEILYFSGIVYETDRVTIQNKFGVTIEEGTLAASGTAAADCDYWYPKGVVNYFVPIEDASETTPSLKYSVIRNHSYHLNVKTISSMGYPDGHTTNTADLIEDIRNIKVEIVVLDWHLINQDVNL